MLQLETIRPGILFTTVHHMLDLHQGMNSPLTIRNSSKMSMSRTRLSNAIFGLIYVTEPGG